MYSPHARAPEQPDFQPDVLSLLDFVSKWIRRRFFGRIAGGGGLWTKVLLALAFSYWNSGY